MIEVVLLVASLVIFLLSIACIVFSVIEAKTARANNTHRVGFRNSRYNTHKTDAMASSFLYLKSRDVSRLVKGLQASSHSVARVHKNAVPRMEKKPITKEIVVGHDKSTVTVKVSDNVTIQGEGIRVKASNKSL